MSTPHEYLPVGKNTYDALDGAFASIGRSADREHAVEMALREVFKVGGNPDIGFVGEPDLTNYLNERAVELLARLDEIDRS